MEHNQVILSFSYNASKPCQDFQIKPNPVEKFDSQVFACKKQILNEIFFFEKIAQFFDEIQYFLKHFWYKQMQRFLKSSIIFR